MRLKAAALALVLGLGIVGLASAQESGNWFTRMFTPTPKTEPAKKSDVKTETPSAPSLEKLNQAEADLDRRQAVCMKLREIGIESGDEDLVRKAEQLDQRALELYYAAKNRLRDSTRPIAEVSAKDLGLTKSKGDR